MPDASGPLTRSRALLGRLFLEVVMLGGTNLDTCLTPESEPVMTS